MVDRLKVARLDPKAILPVYATSGAAGMDVHARLDEPLTIHPMERALIPTGLAFEIPSGYEVQVRPRSGLAVRYGVTVLNSPGTIDEDYRGEVKVLLINLGTTAYTFEDGDRVAQLVVTPTTQMEAQLVLRENLSSTDRGAGGFGSTGSS